MQEANWRFVQRAIGCVRVHGPAPDVWLSLSSQLVMEGSFTLDDAGTTSLIAPGVW
jgi:hypothetical protein